MKVMSKTPKEELLKLVELIERADLVMLQLGEKRVGLDRGLKKLIVDALRLYAELMLIGV